MIRSPQRSYQMVSEQVVIASELLEMRKELAQLQLDMTEMKNWMKEWLRQEMKEEDLDPGGNCASFSLPILPQEVGVSASLPAKVVMAIKVGGRRFALNYIKRGGKIKKYDLNLPPNCLIFTSFEHKARVFAENLLRKLIVADLSGFVYMRIMFVSFCCDYVWGMSWDPGGYLNSFDCDGVDSGGLIDNTNLVNEFVAGDDSGFIELDPSVYVENDFVLVSAKVWDQHFDWYKGGPILSRLTKSMDARSPISYTDDVDLCFFFLRLHYEDARTSIQIDEMVTVVLIYEKVIAHLKLEEGKIDIQLYDYFGGSKHKLLSPTNSAKIEHFTETPNEKSDLDNPADKSWAIYKAQNELVIKDLFYGQSKSTRVCNLCKAESGTYETCMILSLSIPETRIGVTVTVIFADGSRVTSIYSVSVPTHDLWSNLHRAVSTACGLMSHESLKIQHVNYDKSDFEFPSIKYHLPDLTIYMENFIVAYRFSHPHDELPLLLFRRYRRRYKIEGIYEEIYSGPLLTILPKEFLITEADAMCKWDMIWSQADDEAYNTDTIPAWLGSLLKWGEVKLSSNQFFGELPLEIFYSSEPLWLSLGDKHGVFWTPQNHVLVDANLRMRFTSKNSKAENFSDFEEVKEGLDYLLLSISGRKEYVFNCDVREAVLPRSSPSQSSPLCSRCQHRSPVLGKPPRWFGFRELEVATSGFSEKNFLAEGVLQDGQVGGVIRGFG